MPYCELKKASPPIWVQPDQVHQQTREKSHHCTPPKPPECARYQFRHRSRSHGSFRFGEERGLDEIEIVQNPNPRNTRQEMNPAKKKLKTSNSPLLLPLTKNSRRENDSRVGLVYILADTHFCQEKNWSLDRGPQKIFIAAGTCIRSIKAAPLPVPPFHEYRSVGLNILPPAVALRF